jgi:hypothetical protein
MQAFSSFASLIAIFIYMMVLLSTLKLAIKNKVKSNVFEISMYSLTFCVLGVIFIYHYYALVHNVMSAEVGTQKFIKAVTGCSIEFATTLLIVGFFFA